jgi:hypothetical protein
LVVGGLSMLAAARLLIARTLFEAPENTVKRLCAKSRKKSSSVRVERRARKCLMHRPDRERRESQHLDHVSPRARHAVVDAPITSTSNVAPTYMAPHSHQATP